ncbi:10109_t:CDS:10, partial [Cetraspora pellucida]
MFFGGVYCSVKLCWSSAKQIILYEWTQFGDDALFVNITQSPLVFESQNSLLHYINDTKTLQYKGGLSLPWLLRFTNTENVQWLRGYIGNHFSHIFSIEKQIYQDEKKMANLINLGKRVANSNNDDKTILKKQATQLKTEGWENAQQIIQGLGHKLKTTTSKLQNTRKRLSRSQKKVSNLQEILECESDTSSEDEINDNESGYNSEDEIQEFQELMQFLISKGKLGSSLFVIKTFYGNEMPRIDFSNLVAAAGLAGSVNREEWSTMLCLCDITRQSGKSQYFQNQEKFFDEIKAAAEESANNALCMVCEEIVSKGNEILEVGFDCAWSKVREAPQASAEFIYNGTPEGFQHKPIVAFNVVEKPCIYNKNEKNVIINKGNYNNSSRQMEHANLISIISKVTPTLYKYNLTLDIGVDGDLSTNKTLSEEKVVHKIFADLKHKSKILRNKIVGEKRWKQLEQLIMDFYTKSIYAAVARTQNPNIISPNNNDLYIMQSEKVENPEIQLADPNLIRYSQNSINALKEFLKQYTKLPQKQSLITNIRTSMNELFNRVKLNYTDKKVDYAKSFSTRHGLAVLHNNNENLEQKEDKRKHNVAEINKRNALRAKKIAETRKQIEEFDYSKDLIPYGITIKENIINEEFRPSFANLIPDFDGFVLCEGCKCFPKRSPKGGLCRLCYFYYEYGLASYIINPKFHNSNEKQKEIMPIELIDSVVNDFFRLNNYRELQQESIESFLKGHDILTILPIGAGKTLIFSAASVLTRSLTVVFTPLKAIMENQLSELVKMGIPAATIYASLDQPVEVQEKIFGEVAASITKVLWITPKKFIESLRFRRFLHNVFQTRGIQFVIDETHCVLEYGHFRPAWTKLGKIKEEFTLSSILLLIATCSYEGVSKLKSILKIPNLKDIIEAVYKILEQCLESWAIIYSSTPNECTEIFNGLKEYINHKLLELKYIIATNAFGMGVHMSDVQIIIHTTFPLSPTNFVQEIGRAGRDGQPSENAESNSSETQAIQSKCSNLKKQKKNIFAMAYIFENSYQCRRKMAYEPFRWPGDTEIPECGICDNCTRCIADGIVWYNIGKDLLRILDTVDKLVEFANDPTTHLINFGCDDIVDVFMKANNKNTREKNLTSLWENESDSMKDDTFIRTRSMCLHAIDRLCVEELLIQIVKIKPIRLGSSIMIYKSFISGIAPGARQKIIEDVWLEAFK